MKSVGSIFLAAFVVLGGCVPMSAFKQYGYPSPQQPLAERKAYFLQHRIQVDESARTFEVGGVSQPLSELKAYFETLDEPQRAKNSVDRPMDRVLGVFGFVMGGLMVGATASNLGDPVRSGAWQSTVFGAGIFALLMGPWLYFDSGPKPAENAHIYNQIMLGTMGLTEKDLKP